MVHERDPERAMFRALAMHGEMRANLLRLAAVCVFYLIELVDFHGLPLFGIAPAAGMTPVFHQLATGLAVAWSFTAFAIWLCLSHHRFNAAMKFTATAADLFLLTMLLLAANGPSSPLCIVYALIIAASALRFSLALLWMATAGAVFGYLVLVADAHWHHPEHQVPHHHLVIVIAALVLLGVIVGQILRTARGALKSVIAPAPSVGGGP